MCQNSLEQQATAKRSSRRKRLWELDHKYHCLVIGTCFEIRELRRLIGRQVKVPELISDFDLHRCTVQACEARSKISEQLQKILESRYSLSIKQARRLTDTLALRNYWQQALQHGVVDTALWVTLTHADCDEHLADEVYGDLHMLQHQIGTAHRRDLAATQALQREHAALLRELASAQARASQDRDQRIAEITALRQELADLKKERAGLLEHTLMQTRSIDHLQQQLATPVDHDRLLRRLQHAESQVHALREQLSQQAASTELRKPAECTQPNDAEACAEQCTHAETCNLAGRQVLCIGGRPGVVTFYRQLVESYGGSFRHHDGGMEENLAQLEPSIAAADAVICQAGCINHNAYWRVKDFCKRTGKPCVFVKNSGLGSFQRGLSELLAQAEH